MRDGPFLLVRCLIASSILAVATCGSKFNGVNDVLYYCSGRFSEEESEPFLLVRCLIASNILAVATCGGKFNGVTDALYHVQGEVVKRKHDYFRWFAA